MSEVIKPTAPVDARIVYDSKYEFVRELGGGGFGRVFLARDRVARILRAIKQLKSRDPKDQENIVHEIRLASRLNHPDVVTYAHNFSQDGLLFLVMEYCPQGSLRDVLRKNRVGDGDALLWTLRIAEALASVHTQGMVHHDIKPDNILFSEQGTPKISDFGIANLLGGTRPYMAPELFQPKAKPDDPRVDIYALGVTLLEALTGTNPFAGLTPDQMVSLHHKGDFGIKSLPNWQQEIILKAINHVPELRFQTMTEFAEAIRSEQVPLILDKQVLTAGELARRAEQLLTRKKWMKAKSLLDYASENCPASVNVLKTLGRYHLMRLETPKAKAAYEKALRLNPRLEVQKELGWLNLELGNYPAAISFLSDHLHRQPSDWEAYNMLMRCYYETDRFEVALHLASTVLAVNPGNTCLVANHYLCSIMLQKGEVVLPNKAVEKRGNPFVEYNRSVVAEKEKTHSLDKKPTLKSKLLFMDYRFARINPTPLYFTRHLESRPETDHSSKPIIKIGREGFQVNTLRIPGGTAVSRRHCVIVNSKDDVMLYDLDSLGTYVNGVKVKRSIALLGRTRLRIANTEYKITTDRDQLL